MDWKDICDLTHWLSLKSITPAPEELDEDIVKLGEGMYARPVPYNENLDRSDPGCPFAGYVLWAPSDGAARRAMSLDIEAYDQPTELAPPPLLTKYGATYGEIKDVGKQSGTRLFFESATYRIARDGLFVYSHLYVDNLEFYFRLRRASRKERPFAVAVHFPSPRRIQS